MNVVHERPTGRTRATDPCGDTTPQRRGPGLRLTRFGLAAYIAFLAVRSVIAGGPQPAADASFRLRDVMEPSAWLAEFTAAGLSGVVEALVLGLLLGLATWVPKGRPKSNSPVCQGDRPLFPAGRLGQSPSYFAAAPKSKRNAARRIVVWLLGAAVLVLFLCVQWRRCPGVTSLLMPLAGYWFGGWVGSTFAQGSRAALRLVPKLGLLLLTLAAGAALLWALAFDSAGLPFEPPRVTSAETRRLADVFGGAHAARGELKRVRLGERDLDVIAALVLAQLPLEGKAKLTLSEGRIETQLSLAAPSRVPRMRYVNIRAILVPKVTVGRLGSDLERLRVGRLRVPTVLVRGLFARFVTAVHNDPDLGEIVGIVDSVQVEQDGLELVYRPDDLSDSVFSSLLARIDKEPDVPRTTAVYFRHLVAAADRLPDGDQRFAGFIRTAFALASERSRTNDPVLEARAAILALGILLGHGRVEDLVGRVTDRELRMEARRRVGKVTLRNRRDLPRHFFVSAALALVSNGAVSDGAGLFKEELDAGEGGSGFSFADLLADRAGTQFALAATRDALCARSMQERLSQGFAIEEVFPVATDLPEGISSTELRTEYGGVGGVRYEQVVAEIERRLQTCAALRPAVIR